MINITKGSVLDKFINLLLDDGDKWAYNNGEFDSCSLIRKLVMMAFLKSVLTFLVIFMLGSLWYGMVQSWLWAFDCTFTSNVCINADYGCEHVILWIIQAAIWCGYLFYLHDTRQTNIFRNIPKAPESVSNVFKLIRAYFGKFCVKVNRV